VFDLDLRNVKGIKIKNITRLCPFAGLPDSAYVPNSEAGGGTEAGRSTRNVRGRRSGPKPGQSLGRQEEGGGRGDTGGGCVLPCSASRNMNGSCDAVQRHGSQSMVQGGRLSGSGITAQGHGSSSSSSSGGKAHGHGSGCGGSRQGGYSAGGHDGGGSGGSRAEHRERVTADATHAHARGALSSHVQNEERQWHRQQGGVEMQGEQQQQRHSLQECELHQQPPPPQQQQLNLPINEPMLLISVTDTGIGIPPSILKHLFQCFRQGHETMARRCV